MRCADLESSLRQRERSQPLHQRRPDHRQDQRRQQVHLPLGDHVVEQIFAGAGQHKSRHAVDRHQHESQEQDGCRGWINAQISGSDCQLIFFFAGLAGAAAVVVVAVVAMGFVVTWENIPFDAAGVKGTTSSPLRAGRILYSGSQKVGC